MAELLFNGLIVCVIGLGTVFVVLGLLWGILEISKRIFASSTKEVAAPQPAAPKAVPQPAAPAPKAAPVADGMDEDELVAVLTAAVAASLGHTSTYHLNIKSYRQVAGNTPVWNRAARTENVR